MDASATPVSWRLWRQHLERIRLVLSLLFNPEGPYTLLLWNEVPRDHPYYGFGTIIVVYMDPLGNEWDIGSNGRYRLLKLAGHESRTFS